MSIKGIRKARMLVFFLLDDIGELTTEELIAEIELLGIDECRDRVPSALADLSEENLIDKKLSREKKAIIWSLSQSFDRFLLDEI